MARVHTLPGLRLSLRCLCPGGLKGRPIRSTCLQMQHNLNSFGTAIARKDKSSSAGIATLLDACSWARSLRPSLP
jgi:hypothetical protein